MMIRNNKHSVLPIIFSLFVMSNNSLVFAQNTPNNKSTFKNLEAIKMNCSIDNQLKAGKTLPQTAEWQALQKHYEAIKDSQMRDMFACS